jgi:hypothetical protein
LVEHYLDTVGVTGSSPVLRTILSVSSAALLHLFFCCRTRFHAWIGGLSGGDLRITLAVVIPLRLAILILLVATTHVAAAPLVKRKNETYQVTGSNLEELRQMIDRSGPVNSDDGKHYDGLTEWSLTWGFNLKRRGKVWIVVSRTVLLDIKVVTPRWTGFKATPALLKTHWRAYRANPVAGTRKGTSKLRSGQPMQSTNTLAPAAVPPPWRN